MLKFITIIAVVLGAQIGFAQQPAATGPIHINVDSEAKDLAQGFAQASGKLTRPPVSLAFQKEGTVWVLDDVKSIQNVEGVLLVEVGKGLLYVINPKDVVYVTDGSKLAPTKAEGRK